MNILIVGSESQAQELNRKFGDKHRYTNVADLSDMNPADVVFDLVAKDQPERLTEYREKKFGAIFFDSCTTTLRKLTADLGTGTVFGFCGLPSLIDRAILEVSVRQKNDEVVLKALCEKLQTDYRIVDDRVGMITPRVVCMIINEAYHTVEEGTASRGDIDLAMKLGTNYPFGPFEWGGRIGLAHVVRLLDAMRKETGDDRYIVSALLRKESVAS